MQPCAMFVAVAAFLAPSAGFGSEPAAILARGQAEMARKDYQAALQTFLTLPMGAYTPLGQATREGVVAAYAHVGGPEAALRLFRRVAGDHAPAMLERLAVRYGQLGRFGDSSRIYQQLLALNPMSPNICVWQVALVQNSLIAGTKPEQLFRIRMLFVVDDALENRRAEQHRQCSDALHDILFELSAIWTKELTMGCTAYSWQHWPQLDELIQDTLERFPKDPRAPELRGYLARLHDLQRR
jgi:tetratricopeptide (TPR) repeat protein